MPLKRAYILSSLGQFQMPLQEKKAAYYIYCASKNTWNFTALSLSVSWTTLASWHIGTVEAMT